MATRKIKGNLLNFGYFGGFNNYYGEVRKEITSNVSGNIIKEKVFEKAKETIDNVVLLNNFNFIMGFLGGGGKKGNFHYSSEYVESVVKEDEDAFGLFVDYCHKKNLKVLLHDLDDNNIGEFGIPVCYELVKKYDVDGFGIERPPVFFGEYLMELEPTLELHTYVCWEKYDKPWQNWSMSNLMERKKMYAPNSVLYMSYCYGGGLVTEEETKRLTIEAIEDSEIEGIATYHSDNPEMRKRIKIIGELLNKYNINPKRSIKQKNKTFPDLQELVADKYYVAEVEVDKDSAIHSPVWFFNHIGSWEWMGVIIFPRFTFDPPRWRTYFPKKYIEKGYLGIKFDPSELDPGRGDPEKINGYNRTNNYYVDRCLIKSIKVMIPPFPGIKENVIAHKSFPNGIEISSETPTKVTLTL